MNGKRILVVDDEIAIAEMIVEGLTLAGYVVFSAIDAFSAIKILRSEKIDLIISDINMPKISGFEFLQTIRDKSIDTPVIFLTARNSKPDIASGFRLGADDYITKPFGLEELSLRCAAILRRTKPDELEQAFLSCGPLSIDEQAHKVFLDKEEIALSPTEFRLLVLLLENKNRVLTKELLLDRIWGIDFAESTAVVDTFISYLRKKIHKNGFSGIKTVRGVGFSISEN